MFILIDGYNLLKNALNLKRVSPKERFQFLQRLNSYFQRKNLVGQIVFDGYDDIDSFSSKKLEVSYSGYDQTADDFIKELAPKIKNDLLIVSSDRALCDYLENEYNVEYMDSLEFFSFIKRSEICQNETHLNDFVKMSENKDFELDQLMEESLIEFKDEAETEERQEKLSKNEKRIFNKIKKL